MRQTTIPALAIALLASCRADSSAKLPAGSEIAVATPTPPLPDSLLDIARRVVLAWTTGDTVPFRRHLSERFVDFKFGYRVGKDGMIDMVRSTECRLTAWSLTDPQVAMIDPTVYVLAYAGSFEGTCRGPDGQNSAMLSPTRAATIFVSERNEWAAAFHSENRIMGPGASPGRGTTTAGTSLRTAGTQASGERDTTATARRHAAVWQMAVTGDVAGLTGALAPSVVLVDADGQWVSGRDAVVAHISRRPRCTGRVDIVPLAALLLGANRTTGATVVPISPAAELVTLRLTGPPSCGSESERYQTAVYVQSGGERKLAFLFDSRAG